MKYTLITGATGFIGRSLIKTISKKKIIVLVRNKKSHIKGYKNINVDISKKKINFNFLKNVESIIHLASISEEKSKKDRNKTKQVNYVFIKNLIKQSKKYDIKRIIKISTSKVYGLNQNKKITENSKLKPYNDYVNYHAKSDQLLYKEINKKKFDIIILRLSNGFGAPKIFNKDCWGLIINNFCYNAFKYKKIFIKTDINYKKNFIDMKNIIQIIKLFYDYPKKINGIYNVGAKKSFTLNQIVKIIQKTYLTKNMNNISLSEKKIVNNKFEYDISKITKLGFKTINRLHQEIRGIFSFLKKNKNYV